MGVPHRKAEGMTLAALLRNYLETLSTHKDIRRARAGEIEQLANDKVLGTVRLSDHRSWAMLHRYTHLSAMALAEKMNANP